jgi:uncharacterized repeat protein (TIGR02543 family)
LLGSITGKEITLEGPNTLSFTVAPVEEGTGTVKITINLPPGHGITKAEVVKDGVKLPGEITLDGNEVVFEGEYAAGDYFFSIRLYKGSDLYGVVSEIAQIRGYLGSEKTYTLGLADLDRTYTITYHLDGGVLPGGVENPGYYRSTDAELSLPTPSCTGYIFGGWHDNAELSGDPQTGIPNGSTGDKTFWAKWTAITYTVEYDANGGDGETMEATTHAYDEPQYLRANAYTRTGYDFAEWTTEADGSGTPYADGESVSNLTSTQDEAVPLYAQWTAIDYAITYNLNSGINGANPTSYTIESLKITLAAPTRTGYDFGGWYVDDGFTGSAITAIPTGSTEPKTFWAKWTLVSYTITYNLNGGTNSSENPGSYTIKSPDITLAAPTLYGHAFGGWHDNAGLNGEAQTVISQGSTEPKTFWAKWVEGLVVTIQVSRDNTILVSSADVTISRSGAGGNATTFTAVVSDAYEDNIQWYLDGTPAGTAQSITIEAADYPSGTSYRGYLGVTVVSKDDVPYSTSIRFTVTD